jgi:hypothetical protein
MNHLHLAYHSDVREISECIPWLAQELQKFYGAQNTDNFCRCGGIIVSTITDAAGNVLDRYPASRCCLCSMRYPYATGRAISREMFLQFQKGPIRLQPVQEMKESTRASKSRSLHFTDIRHFLLQREAA